MSHYIAVRFEDLNSVIYRYIADRSFDIDINSYYIIAFRDAYNQIKELREFLLSDQIGDFAKFIRLDTLFDLQNNIDRRSMGANGIMKICIKINNAGRILSQDDAWTSQ